MIIQNGNQIPINQNCGTIADVSGSLFDLFQPMIFITTVKSIVGFRVVETPTQISFQGNWQLFSPDELVLKPEGQRDWHWYRVFAQPALQLFPDQLITYLGNQYRVMGRVDWSLNGYMEYSLIEDWTGSGP